MVNFTGTAVSRTDGLSSPFDGQFTVTAPTPAVGTFYVAANGSDSNPGTQAAPWATLAKVQNYADTTHFQAGEAVLLRGGDSFTGRLTFTPTNVIATAELPFRVGRYGTGYPTILANNGNASGKVGALKVNCSHIVIEDLILKVAPGSEGKIASGVYIPGTTVVASDITVQRCETNGFYAAPAIVGGPNDGGHIFYEGNGAGLDNLKFFYNIMHGDTPSSKDFGGIKGWGNTWHITVRGCHVYNMGSQNVHGFLASGVLLNDINHYTKRPDHGGLIEYCLAHDIGGNWDQCGGPVGIWSHASDNVVIQYCEAFNVRGVIPRGFRCDENGIGLDAGGGPITNCIVQYNYSHDNGGSGFYHWGASSSGNNVYRFNISHSNNNDDRTTFGEFSFNGLNNTTTGRVDVYNNTFYGSPSSGQIKAALVFQGFNAGMPTPDSIVANNIFSQASGQFGLAVMCNANQNTPTTQFKNNLWHARSGNIVWRSWGGGGVSNNYPSYAAWAAVSGEVNGVNADPKFVSPPEPAGVALQPDSPAIGAGFAVTLPPGFPDFYGTPTSVPYNIGAWEGGTGPIIMLSNATIPNGAPEGTQIGTLSIGNDPGGTWTWTLLGHAMERLKLVGASLQTGRVATNQTAMPYVLAVLEASNGTLTLRRALKLTVVAS